MAILKLTPSCKDYLWGGSRLRTDFGIKSDLEPLAEAWVLSCHPDGPSYLPDGTTLADYVAAHPEALGTDCAKFEQFPVLTKFIDASKNLSIQVHPSNDYALKNEHQYGKTEMWYVLDCVPGAYLYYGFTHEISKEEFAERIKNNTLTEVLNAVPVHKGDCFFIPSGTLHTICKGIVVAEVQQNSNVTYRVYDYGRVGADGKPRALHIEKALDVTRRTPPQKHDFGSHLAQCEYFTVDAKKGAFDGAADEKSFGSLNRIGMSWFHYGMYTTVLRHEWGWEGFLITDGDGADGDVYNSAQAMLSIEGAMLSRGCYINAPSTVAAYGDATSYTYGQVALHNTMRHCLFQYCGNGSIGVTQDSTDNSALIIGCVVGGVAAAVVIAGVIVGVNVAKKKKAKKA